MTHCPIIRNATVAVRVFLVAVVNRCQDQKRLKMLSFRRIKRDVPDANLCVYAANVVGNLKANTS